MSKRITCVIAVEISQGERSTLAVLRLAGDHRGLPTVTADTELIAEASSPPVPMTEAELATRRKVAVVSALRRLAQDLDARPHSDFYEEEPF